ncbi:zinc finger SWIM domain-containing protein 7-like [Scylla paramamosain]|uniref:zinc finger SWIM domain-containing protein 7-like n=1 Tax=Scylla paramamosain TaxID=85552 RepID=UPI003082DDAA
MSRCPSVASVVEGLVQAAGRDYRAAGRVSNDVLQSLHILHGQSLMNALDLIDNKKVMKVVGNSGRWVYQVTGSSGTPYICLPHSIFCQCMAFKFAVLKRRERPLCKHVLASRLATEMGEVEEKTVSDEYVMDILANMD